MKWELPVGVAGITLAIFVGIVTMIKSPVYFGSIASILAIYYGFSILLLVSSMTRVGRRSRVQQALYVRRAALFSSLTVGMFVVPLAMLIFQPFEITALIVALGRTFPNGTQFVWVLFGSLSAMICGLGVLQGYASYRVFNRLFPNLANRNADR